MFMERKTEKMGIKEKFKPRFCPNCGTKLKDIVIAYRELHNDLIEIVYDCYCENCGWSGDIAPDSVHGIDKSELEEE